MSSEVVILPIARADLDETAFFLAGRTPAAGFRFLEAARLTIGLISNFPLLGEGVERTNPHLEGSRRYRIKRIKKYILFDLTTATTIDVVRVLHGSRDTRLILETDERP